MTVPIRPVVSNQKLTKIPQAIMIVLIMRVPLWMA
jgi:hypothetical protein